MPLKFKATADPESKMKSRKEAVFFIWKQLSDYTHVPSRGKGRQFHYGRQELRELMDFIYDGPPQSKEQEVPSSSVRPQP